MSELEHAYLEKIRRDARAAEFAESIAKPGRHLYALMIDVQDEAALAIAIERSSPDQVAHWLICYVTGADAFDEDDPDAEFDGGDEYDDSDGIPF